MLTVALEKLTASDEAGRVEFHPDGALSGRGGIFPSVLDATRVPDDHFQSATGVTDLDELRPTLLDKWRKDTVTEWASKAVSLESSMGSAWLFSVVCHMSVMTVRLSINYQ